ncbi:MAG: hypothetical protein ACREQL_08960, partial [Candidatus Binatia bacterium]
VLLLGVILVGVGLVRAALTPEIEKALGEVTYVYVQSERKTGEWSKPAEIWFQVENGKVCVGTRSTSWRVRRIGWKRTKARIAVGKADGPRFEATAALVKDPALESRLMDDFAKKYPDGWKKHEQNFRDGFKSGERVVVCYTPK